MSYTPRNRLSAVSEPPIIEHEILRDICVDQFEIRATRHSVKLIGLAATPGLGGDADERRIVMRLTLPMDAAVALWADLAFALRQEAACGDVSPAFARAQSRDKTLDN